MARLTGTILSDDDLFRTRAADLLRSAPVAVSVGTERTMPAASFPDVVIVDGRSDGGAAIAAIERIRASHGTVAIFMIASEANPSVILQAMRAGANEFFAWPVENEAFHEGLSRVAARLQGSGPAQSQALVLGFIGAKGGVGTTTLAVNTAVDLQRLGGGSTLVVDMKPGLGEVALFLGVRCRYTLLDALENGHRLDEGFLKELVVRHKSGIDILAGSDNFDRPGAGDGPGIDEILQLLCRQYDYVVVDTGSQLTAPAASTLYASDAVCLVANPDVASVRNTQRLLERIKRLGPAGERIKVLLNRAAEPYPIPPAQIAAALGHPIHETFPSDYRTVAGALNSGVPLTLAGNSDLAEQFERFVRPLLKNQPAESAAEPKKSPIGIQRFASLW